MNIQILGLNHKTAPIDIREKISFPEHKLHSALSSLKKYSSIEENLILSTCNRVEIYAVVTDIASGRKDMQNFICDFHRVQIDEMEKYFYLFTDQEAIQHLFRVVSSLDSMILGETQIFGQVKEAYFKARECQTTGRNLNSLFEEAIKIGKKVRCETRIGKGAVSLSSAAAELAKKIFEDLEGKRVLIIGAGKIGELAVKNLYSRGIKTVLVANRTFERAQELARIFQGKAIKFEAIAKNLKEIDILISSTSAPHFILREELLQRVMLERDYRPLFLIDLGLPRNIEPTVDRIKNIYLYNLDDLAEVRQANIRERLSEAKKVEQIIDHHSCHLAQRLLSPK